MRSIRSKSAKRVPKGFTLLEMLTVITIVVILASLSGRALGPLLGAGSINKASSDFSETLSMARAYAMANNTYVRVAMCQVPAGGNLSTPSIIVVCTYSADGTTSGSWNQLNHILILNDLVFNDSLAGVTPNTNNDVLPDTTALGHIGPLSYLVPGINNSPLTFNSFVQFSPIGEASVLVNGTSSYIKIGCEAAQDTAGKNPFILHLSGANGTITILRKENM